MFEDRVVGMTMAVWLAGCAAGSTGVDTGPPPRMRAHLRAPEQGASPEVQAVGHAPGAHPGPAGDARETRLPDPGEQRTVTLREVLAWADAHAPALEVAQARMAMGEAEAEAAAARVPADPRVTAGLGPRFSEAGRALDVQMGISQPLEVAGEPRLRREMARSTERRLQAELEEARWRVHLRVHHAFHEALAAREWLQAAERRVAFHRRMAEVAQARVRAGDVSPVRQRVADGELARAEQGLVAARRRYDASRLVLAEVSGWPVTRPPVPAGELDPPRPSPPLQKLLELAATHQPQLRIHDAAMVEARSRVALADRGRWPSPRVGVAYQREGSAQGNHEHSVVGRLTFTLPVWQANRAERARARAEVARARGEAEAFAQRLRARIARAALAVNAAAERVALYRARIMPEHEESLRMLERAYELGEIDLLEASVAVERLLDAQLESLEAYEDYHEAAATLEEVVGVDPWPEERHADHGGAP